MPNRIGTTMTAVLPPKKPETFNHNLGSLPIALAYLREENRWVCWRWTWNGRKWTKTPFRADKPHNKAASDNPKTWGCYQQAISQAQTGKVDGIGIALKDSDIGAIDLDKCRDPHSGLIAPWAQEIIDRAGGSYVEITVSGTGLRVLGTVDGLNLQRKFALPDEAGLEIYASTHRYITVSGNEIGECGELKPIGNLLLDLQREYNGQSNGFDFNGSAAAVKPAEVSHDPLQAFADSVDPHEQRSWTFAEDQRIRSALAAVPTDEAMLDQKFTAKGGARRVWLDIGMGLHTTGWGERAYGIFRDWSSGNRAEFDEKSLRYQWNHFKDERSNKVTLGSLFWYARECGWRDSTPMAADAPPETKGTGWIFYEDDAGNPPKWAIKHILPENGVVIMSGQWGMYKTTAALYLVLSLITGLPFAGRYRVKRRGAILYLALEGGGGIKARLQAIADEEDVILGNAPFVRRSDCPSLLDTDTPSKLCRIYDEVAGEIQKQFGVPVAAIWFDTMVIAAGYTEAGQDNDTAATAKILGALRALANHTGAVVIGIDHFGKILETGTKGSSNKEATADAVLALLGDRELNGEVKNTRMAVRKQRDGINGLEVPFVARQIQTGLDEDGDVETAMVLDWKAEQTRAAVTKLTPREVLAKRALANALCNEGQTPAISNLPAGHKAARDMAQAGL
jgi:hypothetical protein